MTLSAILEVAIGLALVYYVLGLIVNIVVRSVKDILDMRAEALETVLKQLFKMNKDTLFNEFKERPLIRNLKPITHKLLQVVNRKKEDRKPSDIPDTTFSRALLEVLSSKDFVFKGIRKIIEQFAAEQSDVIIKQILNDLPDPEDAKVEDLIAGLRSAINKISDKAIKKELNKWLIVLLGTPKNQLDLIRTGIQGLPTSETKDALFNLIDFSMKDVKEAQARLEAWYNDMMKNVTLLFTKKVRKWTTLMSLLIAFIVGADSIYIAQTLWAQPTHRTAIIAAVPGFVEDLGAGEPSSDEMTDLTAEEKIKVIEGRVDDVNKILASLEKLDIPVTWWQAPWPMGFAEWVSKILGLIITGAATSQGASFWYDILKKVNPRVATKKAATPAGG